MRFSILIPTVPNRVFKDPKHFLRITAEVMRQIEECKVEDVEVLGFFDNKKRKIGAKRNTLLQAARGKFCAFIDDDDRIAPDYLKTILEHIDANPDAEVMVFEQDAHIIENGGKERFKHCLYSIAYDYVDAVDYWTGLPAHNMVWRTEVAQKHYFPDEQFGEDTDWVKRAVQGVTKEVKIHKTLYFYDFSTYTTETREPGFI